MDTATSPQQSPQQSRPGPIGNPFPAKLRFEAVEVVISGEVGRAELNVFGDGLLVTAVFTGVERFEQRLMDELWENGVIPSVFREMQREAQRCAFLEGLMRAGEQKDVSMDLVWLESDTCKRLPKEIVRDGQPS